MTGIALEPRLAVNRCEPSELSEHTRVGRSCRAPRAGSATSPANARRASRRATAPCSAGRRAASRSRRGSGASSPCSPTPRSSRTAGRRRRRAPAHRRPRPARSTSRVATSPDGVDDPYSDRSLGQQVHAIADLALAEHHFVAAVSLTATTSQHRAAVGFAQRFQQRPVHRGWTSDNRNRPTADDTGVAWLLRGDPGPSPRPGDGGRTGDGADRGGLAARSSGLGTRRLDPPSSGNNS